ncbi:hypothetical protein, partial [Methanoregula sp.]|uniref:hypothetical protein n=1 Tax=Methanoregula sp. TaxID=2052170 RepID=UPI003C71739C
VVNITTNITTTTYVPKSYILAGTGIVIDGLTVSFLAGIFAFVVGMVALIAILRYSKIITINTEASVSDTTHIPPTSEIPTSPPSDISKSDIDNFCKSVIEWKVSATEKDEIFQLFRENPYYLMGYLAYITKKDIEETKALQKKIIAFTLVSIIIAMGSMAFTGYAINPVFFVSGLGVYALVLFGVFYVMRKSK